MPASSDYNPIEQDKPKRTGCEHEFSIRGIRGDPDTHELKSDERVVEMPKNLLKPQDYPGTAVICPHPSIRTHLPYKKFSEVDPEYNLVPHERRMNVPMDDLNIRNDLTMDLNTRFLSTNNIRVTT